MTDRDIHGVISVLRQDVRVWQTPAVTIVSQRSRDPFRVLVSCLLSLRTKDTTTGPASERLFTLASSPVEMLKLTPVEIEQAIYPVGFYRTKSRQILDICMTLIDRYDGMVPDTIDALLQLKGVGRKTANLVVTLGFGKPGICVDTHVHRICNRLGYISSKTPDQTEHALREKLPAEYWQEINDLLVTYGQNRCLPVSPWCSICRIAGYCDRRGVNRSR